VPTSDSSKATVSVSSQRLLTEAKLTGKAEPSPGRGGLALPTWAWGQIPLPWGPGAPCADEL